MKEFHWIIKDQHGLMHFLTGWMKGTVEAFSYRNHMADDIDLSPFAELEEQSVTMGVGLVTAAYRFRKGEIGEEELRTVIGNRSYAGGEAEE